MRASCDSLRLKMLVPAKSVPGESRLCSLSERRGESATSNRFSTFQKVTCSSVMGPILAFAPAPAGATAAQIAATSASAPTSFSFQFSIGVPAVFRWLVR